MISVKYQGKEVNADTKGEVDFKKYPAGAHAISSEWKSRMCGPTQRLVEPLSLQLESRKLGLIFQKRTVTK